MFNGSVLQEWLVKLWNLKEGQNMCGHDRFGVKLVCVDDRNSYYMEGVGGVGIMVIVTEW